MQIEALSPSACRWTSTRRWQRRPGQTFDSYFECLWEILIDWRWQWGICDSTAPGMDTGGYGLPYYCKPPVCVPDVICALAVWRQNNNQKKHSNTEFRKKNFTKKFGKPETFSGSKFDPATSVTPVLVTNNNNQAILRIEKRSRQELPSLMAENGNACTT